MESLPTSPNPSPPTTIEFKPADPQPPNGSQTAKKCIHHTMNCIATQQAAILEQQQQMQQQQQFHRHFLLQHRAPQFQPAFTLSNQPLTQIPNGSGRQHGFLPTRSSSNASSRLHPYGTMGMRRNFPTADSSVMHQQQDAADSRIFLTIFNNPTQSPAVSVAPTMPSTNVANVDPPIVAPPTPTASVMQSQLLNFNNGCPVQPKIQSNSASPITLDGPVQIQSQAGLVRHVNAALLADRYLLLEPLKGTSLYKCIDVRTHRDLVCKVSHSC